MSGSKTNPNIEPFFYKKGKVGCLLCHGFTGVPHEVHDLGRYLSDKDITTIGPKLPGHGTTIKDMQKTSAKDWYAEYLKAYEILKEHCQEIFIGGLSLGGLLTLKCATENQVAGVIALATPLKVKFPEMTILPLVAPFLPNASVKKSKRDLEYQQQYGIICYKRDPIRPAKSVVKLIKDMRKKLKEITAPILIVQGQKDSKWIIKSAKILLKNTSSQERELIFLEQSPHCFTIGPEKELVNEIVYDFIRKKSTILK
ncbi:MAG: alpha/beta fold hydrolase [Candidatus Heimdallarchaeota archaeon]|nr:alpha/beta fold hydrolase [Candidatus Heimdallarchaeota archaeon]